MSTLSAGLCFQLKKKIQLVFKSFFFYKKFNLEWQLPPLPSHPLLPVFSLLTLPGLWVGMKVSAESKSPEKIPQEVSVSSTGLASAAPSHLCTVCTSRALGR